MVFEGIQSVIKMFSMPLLYAIVTWFAVIGFAARTAMVMILIRVKKAEIVPVSLRLHAMSLIVAYVVAPVCAVITTGLNVALFPELATFSSGSNLYVWYSIVMILSLRYLLCQTFVSVSCSAWQMALIYVDSFVVILGYIFLSFMHFI